MSKHVCNAIRSRDPLLESRAVRFMIKFREKIRLISVHLFCFDVKSFQIVTRKTEHACFMHARIVVTRKNESFVFDKKKTCVYLAAAVR